MVSEIWKFGKTAVTLLRHSGLKHSEIREFGELNFGKFGHWRVLLKTYRATWAVKKQAEAFRHFRIYNFGLDSDNSDRLACAGIELYGTLTVVPKRAVKGES